MQSDTVSNYVMRRLLDAVVAGMYIVRTKQCTPRRSSKGKAEIKSDSSLLTETDKEVEKELRRDLGGLRGYRLRGEEGSTAGSGDMLILVDPIDGTRPFVVGMATSTIIACVVHPKRGVIATVIGEPSTGRIWTAQENKKTRLRVFDQVEGLSRPVPVTTWGGHFDPMSTVWLDAAHGFARTNDDGTKRQILTDRQNERLLKNIVHGAKLSMAGSNGLHQALVANGCEYASGQITSAVGGPWDLAGVLLVLHAGGSAKAFQVRDGELVEKDNPLDIMNTDILVTGNDYDTVWHLARWVEDAFKAKS